MTFTHTRGARGRLRARPKALVGIVVSPILNKRGRHMFKINSVRSACLAILFAFTGAFVGSPALAQSAVTGAVGGAATDPNNAAVANATVTLRSMDTNKSETVTTHSAGRFRFTNLQPGTYAITISATGFSEFKLEQLAVEVGRLSE